jgi:hypothetical protein
MRKRIRDVENNMSNDDNNKRKKSPVPLKRTKKPIFDDDDNIDLNKFFMIMMPPQTGGPPIDNNPPKNYENDVCRNPLCNHKTYEEDPTPIINKSLTEIKHISDLIELGKNYHCKKNQMYIGMNLRILCNLVTPLTELSSLVGMQSVKEHMVDQILFFLQGHHTTIKCGKCVDCSYNMPCVNSQSEMLHTVVTGPPGVGKTELGKILGKVYKEMGILSTGKFKLVTRADLIAGYLGQTAIKTQKVIDECKGGVLFIDEAYSLGNSELRDSFSKECIDTLNQNLSEKRDFLCIIAGYKDALEKCFFSYNDGLRRRFTFRYDIHPYSANELQEIFESKVVSMGWDLCYLQKKDVVEAIQLIEEKDNIKKQVDKLFKKNLKNFPNYGGDMETLLLNCKIIHSRRCIFSDGEMRKCLSFSDIENGIASFVKHRKVTKDSDSDDIGGIYS